MRQSKFMTVPQFAAYLGISQGAVRQRVRRGHLPHTRLGTTIYIPRDALLLLPLQVKGGARS